tara:strand:+ start:51982 stop:52188 length:207 start_codon:yes stop_codon:yes gene_type:complete
LEGLRGNLHTTIGINHKLKNDHVVNLSLTYEYLHDKVYAGDYVIYNGSADGTFLMKEIQLIYLFLTFL